MTQDPLEILTGGTNPVSTAVDLTDNPVVAAAIAASYAQEDQVLAAKVVVGIVSRALQMVPIWGPALGNVLTGAGDQNEIVAGIRSQLAAQQAQAAATGTPAGGSTGSCPLSNLLQSQSIQGLVGGLAGNPQVAAVLKAFLGK